MPFDFFESRKRSFNPRLREGGDFLLSSSVYHLHGFNPRLREGGDSATPYTYIVILRFNPRLREGGDVRRPELISGRPMFQSTPPRGRRRRLYA